MEILNNAQITPQRLHALLKLVNTLRRPTREELLDLLQPQAINPNQDAVKAVYYAAQQVELIEENSDSIVSLHESLRDFLPIESHKNYRLCLQTKLCGIDDDADHNYLLNLFTAWYAVQDERIFTANSKRLTDQFNGELFPFDPVTSSEDYSGRAFNDTKYNGWRTWATFLGWGWTSSIGNGDVMPDATVRLRGLISHTELLPEQEFIPFRTFAGRLGDSCPELDGGKLYTLCWNASRSEQKGNTISLMVSTGLRVLHDLEVIELQRFADATDRWQLFEADGALFNEITHIRAR